MIPAILIAFIALYVTASAIRVVPEGQVWVVERLGRFHRTMQQGLNVVMPFIDRVAHRFSLQEQTLEVAVPVIFFDNEPATIAAHVRYRVSDPERVAYNVADAASTVQQIVTSSVRGEAGQRTRLAMREEMRFAGLAVVRNANAVAEPMGLKIVDCTLER